MNHETVSNSLIMIQPLLVCSQSQPSSHPHSHSPSFYRKLTPSTAPLSLSYSLPPPLPQTKYSSSTHSSLSWCSVEIRLPRGGRRSTRRHTQILLSYWRHRRSMPSRYWRWVSVVVVGGWKSSKLTFPSPLLFPSSSPFFLLFDYYRIDSHILDMWNVTNSHRRPDWWPPRWTLPSHTWTCHNKDNKERLFSLMMWTWKCFWSIWRSWLYPPSSRERWEGGCVYMIHRVSSLVCHFNVTVPLGINVASKVSPSSLLLLLGIPWIVDTISFTNSSQSFGILTKIVKWQKYNKFLNVRTRGSVYRMSVRALIVRALRTSTCVRKWQVNDKRGRRKKKVSSWAGWEREEGHDQCEEIEQKELN